MSMREPNTASQGNCSLGHRALPHHDTWVSAQQSPVIPPAPCPFPPPLSGAWDFRSWEMCPRPLCLTWCNLGQMLWLLSASEGSPHLGWVLSDNFCSWASCILSYWVPQQECIIEVWLSSPCWSVSTIMSVTHINKTKVPLMRTNAFLTTLTYTLPNPMMYEFSFLKSSNLRTNLVQEKEILWPRLAVKCPVHWVLWLMNEWGLGGPLASPVYWQDRSICSYILMM